MKKRKKPEPVTYISMADPSRHPQQRQLSTGGSHQLSGWSLVTASVAGLATGGPLLGISGFSFLASLTLLLLSSPVLLIFSPLIFGAALVLVGATASFGAAAVMGFAGMAMIAWILRSAFRRKQYENGGDIVDEVMDEVKEQGKEWGGYLQQKVQENNPAENMVDRG